MRGKGLLLAAVLDRELAGAACREALAAGLVLNAPRPDVVRFAPSLLVSDDEIDRALDILGPILAGLATDLGDGAGTQGHGRAGEGR